MTLLTRCPNCATTFRVQDDILERHDGRVRCGQCHFVFDARVCRVDGFAAKVAPAPHAPVPVTPAPLSPPPVTVATPQPEVPAPLPAPSAPEPAPEAVPEPAPHDPHHHLVTALQAEFEELDHPLPHFIPAELDEETERILAMRESAPPKPVPAAVHKPAPMADVVVGSSDWLVPPKPRRRWGWWLCTALLLPLLLAQAAVLWRQALIEWQPGLRPLLVAACSYAHCQVAQSHNVDMLALDGVEFSADAKDGHKLQLSGTLRNLAAYAQAWPTLDLQLLDSQGHLVARRPLAPAAYLGPADATQSEFTAGGEVPFSLVLQVDGLDVANYRLGVEY